MLFLNARMGCEVRLSRGDALHHLSELARLLQCTLTTEPASGNGRAAPGLGMLFLNTRMGCEVWPGAGDPSRLRGQPLGNGRSALAARPAGRQRLGAEVGQFAYSGVRLLLCCCLRRCHDRPARSPQGSQSNASGQPVRS